MEGTEYQSTEDKIAIEILIKAGFGDSGITPELANNPILLAAVGVVMKEKVQTAAATAHLKLERKRVLQQAIDFMSPYAHMYADGTMSPTYRFVENLKPKHRAVIIHFLKWFREQEDHKWKHL